MIDSNYRIGFLWQLVKFAWVGAAATAVQYLILFVLVHFGNQQPALASAIGYGLAACVSYALNYFFTFSSRRRHRRAIIRFGTVACIGLILNCMIFFAANEILEMNYLVAQILATVSILGWNFLANRNWTFGASDAENQ